MSELPPPLLTENGDYEKWRNEIQMWQITTTMEPKRQALAVRVKLSGKVREVALKLDAADLNNEGGMSFLITALDEKFKKKAVKKSKWDVAEDPDSKSKEKQKSGEVTTSGANMLSASDKAKQRAAELSAKLAAEGKYQVPSVLPKPSADQFNKNLSAAPAVNLSMSGIGGVLGLPPEVKKLENGNSFAEFIINDVGARQFLTRSSTRDLICQQSGAALTLRGRFLTQEDKRQSLVSGANEKALTLMIQANVAAKVQVALHKVTEVCRNYQKFGAENNFNNYGLSSNAVVSSHHFVQEKLFVGIDNMHPDFNVKEKLAGANGANFSFMIQQTGAKVLLRGRGSGYMEANSGRESFEALHIYVSHPRQDGLDMARELCESLIETVKTQYQEWTHHRIIQPPTTSFIRPPPYATAANNSIRYAAYPPLTNGYNTPATYATVPLTLTRYGNTSQQHAGGPAGGPAGGLPASKAVVGPSVLALSQGALQPPIVDYRSTYVNKPLLVMEQQPRFPHPMTSVNEHRPPECNMQADFMHKYHAQNTPDTRTSSQDRFPQDDEQYNEEDKGENKSDHTNRRRPRGERSNSRSPEMKRNRSGGDSNSKDTLTPRESPSHRDSSPNHRRNSPNNNNNSNNNNNNRETSPSRRKESSPRRKETSPRRRRKEGSPKEKEFSPSRRDHSPSRHRDSPKHRDSSPKHRDASSNRKDAIANLKESNQRVDSPTNRRDSPPNSRESSSGRRSPTNRRESNPTDRCSPPLGRRDRKDSSPPPRQVSPPKQKEPSPPPVRKEKRRFTEEPKKRRKFSEDPRLLEQQAKAKAESIIATAEVFQSSQRSIQDQLTGSKPPPSKLQFRSKKESAKKVVDPTKPKSILKMTPPAMAPPMILPRKVNGLGRSVKISPAGLPGKKSVKTDMFAPTPLIEKSKPVEPPQKALKMGALSSLISMYDDSDDED